jgi:hypothetical protein
VRNLRSEVIHRLASFRATCLMAARAVEKGVAQEVEPEGNKEARKPGAGTRPLFPAFLASLFLLSEPAPSLSLSFAPLD